VCNINCYHQKFCFSSKCTTNRLVAGGAYSAAPYPLAGLRVCAPREWGRKTGREEEDGTGREEKKGSEINLGEIVKERG